MQTSTPPASEETVSKGAQMGVTFRVVILSLALAALFGYLIPLLDFQIRNSYLSAGPFPVGAVAVLLFLLLILNPILSRFRGRLSRAA